MHVAVLILLLPVCVARSTPPSVDSSTSYEPEITTPENGGIVPSISERDMVDSVKRAVNNTEKRSRRSRSNDTVRAVDFDDDKARALDYDEKARALDYDEKARALDYDEEDLLKRAQELNDIARSSPVEENPERAVNSSAPEEAGTVRSLSERGMVDSVKRAVNNTEKRSRRSRSNDTVRAVDFDDDKALALDYDEKARALDYDEKARALDYDEEDRHKRDERSSETGLFVPPKHSAMVGVPLSYNRREAEAIPSSNEPDTVGSRRSTPTNPEERSEGDNSADGDRALDYKEENVPLM